MSNEVDGTERDSTVHVAVRIRPQHPREVIDLCRSCTTVTPGEPQIVLGQEKAFTFDYVFDVNSVQNDIYAACVSRLVEGALCGYNATVLAYGQTGSGKTFTMGTGFEQELHTDQQGIIPRAVADIFDGINRIQNGLVDDDVVTTNTPKSIQFSVAAQFMELYNEDIIDLLDPYSKSNMCKIHEDASGQITVAGAIIKPIHGPQDALKCLKQGALARTTASTKMNDQSSRSHALFTILIRRQSIISGEEDPDGDLQTLTSKFHFVDLAGSERLKRTGATGERAREGISINCGLLALGNCISALGDLSKKATHVPYRDSKLTRLLQDSLGGNSQTLMIACISPSDRDFMETLNTLKYANRARNIKNKVVINKDQNSRTISQLRKEIAALQLEVLEYKQGKRVTDNDGNSAISDTFQENFALSDENKRLLQRIKAMQETINALTNKNTQLLVEKEMHGLGFSEDMDQCVATMIASYLAEIEKLQTKLIESEEMCKQLKKSGTKENTPRGLLKIKNTDESPEDLINKAKLELEKTRDDLMSRSLPGFNVDNEYIGSEGSDSESDASEIQADLNEINSDIEMKTKLIEQLELSQHRIQLMRQHYEDKLSVLNSKIVSTQKERDEVLLNMDPNFGAQSNEKIKKIRDEYQRKLNDMQRELKKLQQAQRDNSRHQRELQSQEAKLRTLRNELAELKSIKGSLMRKMSEQSSRHKEMESQKTREIAQLRKEQRRQQNTVKSLQAKMNAKDLILKRKTEEVSALRRRSALSQKAAGRLPANKNNQFIFSSRLTRQRWDNLCRGINRAARNKQVVLQLEKELDRLLSEHEGLSHQLVNLQLKENASKRAELAYDEDTIKSNLTYVQDNITHIQQTILEFEEGKDSSTDLINLQTVIGNVQSVDEAKVFLERVTEMAVTSTCNSAIKDSRLKEYEELLKEVQQESSIQQQLLQHFLAQNNAIKLSDLFDSLELKTAACDNANNLSGSQKSFNSNETYDITHEGTLSEPPTAMPYYAESRSPSPTSKIDLTQEKTVKVRRRTAQPQDLLFGNIGDGRREKITMSSSFSVHEVKPRSPHTLTRTPSEPGIPRQGDSSVLSAMKSYEVSSKLKKPKLSQLAKPDKGHTGL